MYKKNIKNLFGHTLVETGRQIKMYNLNLFREQGFDITPEQFVILSFLEENSNMHQMQLCEALFKDRSNMARILNILETKGLITKQPDVDRRLVNKIKITQKGKDLKNLIAPYITNSRKKFLNGLSEEELSYCINILEKIQNNLK